MKNKKLKILLLVVIFLTAYVTYNKANIDLVIPFNTYTFNIEGVDKLKLYDFSISYDFNTNKGNVTFQIGGTETPNSISIDLPKGMKVIEYNISNRISVLKLNKDYSTWNNTNRINFSNFSKNLDGYMFVVSIEGNESFKPNSRFIVSASAKKIEYKSDDFYDLHVGLKLILGKYACNFQCYSELRPEEPEGNIRVQTLNDAIRVYCIFGKECPTTFRVSFNVYDNEKKQEKDFYDKISIGLIFAFISLLITLTLEILNKETNKNNSI